MDQVLKTLIVDDSLSQCQVLREHLLHYGVSIADYCHDGYAALEKLEQSHSEYDALFVDLHMEGMDGLELMHQLHNLGYRGGIVIVSALNPRVINYTMEVVSNYSLRLLGSIEKPIERSLVAFMVRRIRSATHNQPTLEELPKRREVAGALNNNNLHIHFQPIVNGHTNEVHALECLSRLEIPGRGLVSPALFVPVVEKFGLLEMFMDKLFIQVAPAYKRIQESTQLGGKLNINISPQQLFNDALPTLLSEQIDAQGLDKESIGLEITENYSLAEEQQQKNLSRLRIHGFQLSLDDYGAGYTNMRQVTNLPFNEIKLDSELVNGMHKDKILKIVVESVYKITHELNLNLIAEGINNPHDLIMLDEIGIHLYQGYFFSKPKPCDELIDWFKSWKNTMDESQAFDRKVMNRNKK